MSGTVSDEIVTGWRGGRSHRTYTEADFNTAALKSDEARELQPRVRWSSWSQIPTSARRRWSSHRRIMRLARATCINPQNQESSTNPERLPHVTQPPMAASRAESLQRLSGRRYDKTIPTSPDDLAETFHPASMPGTCNIIVDAADKVDDRIQTDDHQAQEPYRRRKGLFHDPMIS